MKDFYHNRPFMAALAALYAIAALVMGVQAGEPSSIIWWAVAFPFLAWVASPVVVGLSLSRFMSRKLTRAIFVAAVVAIGLYGFLDQWHVMFIGPSDAQNALVMIFDPMLQWVAVGLVFFIASFAERYVLKS